MAAPALAADSSAPTLTVWHCGSEAEIPLPTAIPYHAAMTWRDVRFAFASAAGFPVPNVTLTFPGNATPPALDAPADPLVRVEAVTTRRSRAATLLAVYDFLDVWTNLAINVVSEPALPTIALRRTQALAATGVLLPLPALPLLVRRLVRTEGVAALFRGTLTGTLFALPAACLHYVLSRATAPATAHAASAFVGLCLNQPLRLWLGTPRPAAAPRGLWSEVSSAPSPRDFARACASLLPALPLLACLQLVGAAHTPAHGSIKTFAPLPAFLDAEPSNGLTRKLVATISRSLLYRPFAFVGTYLTFSLPQRSLAASLRELADPGLLSTFLLHDVAADAFQCAVHHLAFARPARLRAAFTARGAEDERAAWWLLGGAAVRLAATLAGGVALWRWMHAEPAAVK